MRDGGLNRARKLNYSVRLVVALFPVDHRTLKHSLGPFGIPAATSSIGRAATSHKTPKKSILGVHMVYLQDGGLGPRFLGSFLSPDLQNHRDALPTEINENQKKHPRS